MQNIVLNTGVRVQGLRSDDLAGASKGRMTLYQTRRNSDERRKRLLP